MIIGNFYETMSNFLANKLLDQDYEKIQELLRCKICYDFISTAVITNCSHNYCSLCIRKYLYYKTECPMCFRETYEKDLRPNRIVDEILEVFLQRQSSTKHDDMKTDDVDNSVASNCNDINPENDKVSDGKVPENLKINRSPKKIQKISCPTCNVGISKFYLDKHVDICSKPKTSSTPSTSKAQQSLKPMPKLVLNLMKDSELKKKMKELGLTTQGNRKALEKRFQKYHIIYNAECDKTNPRSINELIKQCLEEENIENKLLKSSSDNKIFQFTKRSEQSEIDKAKRQYLEKHSDDFESLINQIKTRQSPKEAATTSIDNNSNSLIDKTEQTKSNSISSNQVTL